MHFYSLNFKVPDALQNHLLLKSLTDNIVIGLYIHICMYLYAPLPIWLLSLIFQNINGDIFDLRRRGNSKYQDWNIFYLPVLLFIYLFFYLSIYLPMYCFEHQIVQLFLIRNNCITAGICSFNDSE